MSYKHPGMPPVIRRTGESSWVLESQEGVVIAEYAVSGMRHPHDWWTDVFDAMASAYLDPMNLAHDLTLLAVSGDYEIIDDR